MINKVITARVDLENKLWEAIKQQQFRLHYQMQVDHTGQVLGAEVLYQSTLISTYSANDSICLTRV
ncbi:MAG: sensor c-di-GMP phosphodiesterase-like protein [Paraglaciecola sp.]|jgi:sensor c-di-GMP phosphodiesterase-like protein